MDQAEKEHQKADDGGTGNEGEEDLFSPIQGNPEAPKEDETGRDRDAGSERRAGKDRQDPLQALRV